MRATLVGWMLALAPVPAAADETAVRPAPTVSLQAGGESLRATLRKLSAAAKTPIRVEPAVPDVPVRLNLRDVSADHALRLVVRHASRQAHGLEYESSGEGFRVFLRTPDEPVVKEDPNRVTITVRKSPPAPAAPPEQPSGNSPGGEGALAPEVTIAGQGIVQGPDSASPEPQGQQPSSIYLIEPVAPYFLRSPFGVPAYRPGLLIPGVLGKKRKTEPKVLDRHHVYLRIEPISGSRLGVMHSRPPKPRRKPQASGRGGGGNGSGGSSGPGGVGQRPF